MEDPMEKMIARALERGGFEYVQEGKGQPSPCPLDFYIPGLDIHIEVKQFHSDRIAVQMKKGENVIVAQGRGAVAFLADLLETAGKPKRDEMLEAFHRSNMREKFGAVFDAA